MRMTSIVLRIGLLVGAALVAAHSGAALASNGNKCPKLGYCPPGSCAQDGSAQACNIKNCSPHNCRH
jgi:hypothetical protein